MKILLKILVAPFALALSLLAALLVFLFDICAVLLTIASVILVVLGVALFFTPTPIGGIVFLFSLSFFRLSFVWTASGGGLLFGRWTEANPLCTGFWQVNSLGPCWPEVGAVWMGRPFSWKGGMISGYHNFVAAPCGRRRNDCRGNPGLSDYGKDPEKTERGKYLRL